MTKKSTTFLASIHILLIILSVFAPTLSPVSAETGGDFPPIMEPVPLVENQSDSLTSIASQPEPSPQLTWYELVEIVVFNII